MVRRRFTLREEEPAESHMTARGINRTYKSNSSSRLNTSTYEARNSAVHIWNHSPGDSETHENQRLLQNDKIQGANRTDGLNGV